MKTYDLSPAELHQQIRTGELVSIGDKVLIITSDGLERRTVVSAVDEDSIHGESVQISIDDIRAIEVRKFSAGKTTLVVVGGLFAAMLIFLNVAEFAVPGPA